MQFKQESVLHLFGMKMDSKPPLSIQWVIDGSPRSPLRLLLRTLDNVVRKDHHSTYRYYIIRSVYPLAPSTLVVVE